MIKPSQSQKLGTNYFTLFDSYSVDESFLGVHNYIDLSLSINAVSNGLNKNGFSLYPIDTSHGHVESKFPIYITQNASEHTLGSNNGCYDHIGNPIIGSGSSTIYVLDTIYEMSPYINVYSYTRPYFIEIDFKLYRSPN